MRIASNNQTFGAIKLKGVEPGSIELTRIRELTEKASCDVRLDLSSEANNFFINTKNNSGTEFNLLTQITNLMAGKKNIEATIVSDSTAQRAIPIWKA